MANEVKTDEDVRVGAGMPIADKPGKVKVVYDLPPSLEYPKGKSIPLTVITN